MFNYNASELVLCLFWGKLQVQIGKYINRQIKQRLTWRQMRTRNCAEKTERDFSCPICPLCDWSSRFLDLSSSCILDPGEWSLSLVNLRSRQREEDSKKFVWKAGLGYCLRVLSWSSPNILCYGLLQKDLFSGEVWQIMFSNSIIILRLSHKVCRCSYRVCSFRWIQKRILDPRTDFASLSANPNPDFWSGESFLKKDSLDLKSEKSKSRLTD